MKKQKNNRRLTLAIAFALGCCVFSASDAFAEEANAKAELAFDLEGITVEAARPDWESKLSPGSVTVINPDDYKGEQKTLPDLMRKVPGVHVREVNGKGQYTTVTVRGSTAAQVGVFIDGVLSNLGGDSAVDLSTIPVSNVERIEVYRGYIPARFAGTYIGGVINIVTKKPEKADVNLELGTSSYGGKKGALEIVAPLGDGSLMFGANYESSDGDFSYENYAGASDVQRLNTSIASMDKELAKFDNDKIAAYATYLGLTEKQQSEFITDNKKWIEYAGNGGFTNDYKKYLQVKYESNRPPEGTFTDAGLEVIDVKTWKGMSNDEKDVVFQKIAENKALSASSATSSVYAGQEETLEKEKKALAEAENAKRWRKYNDYENINSILKWQNENWMVKAAWNKIDRHLPDSLWNGEVANALHSYNIDLYDTYYYSSRRQEIDTKELMLQNRNNVGKLEWGWLIDYTKSDKSYRAENIKDNNTTNYDENYSVLRRWSRYESDKYNAQIDGTYKVSDNNMLDFQVNFSHETLDVNGHNMDKVLDQEYIINSTLGQIRNRYDQDLLNIQVQDTITLDGKSSWFLTPSVRYNRSTITGYSDGARFSNRYEWVTPRDEQTDDQVTWQIALKKEFDSGFTMRMTGGTYYRLLNMYEIAGDGAGVLPAPNNNGRESSFPYPEEGKQFDISALWNGKALGGFNKTTLTYFWRDSDNMLQLQRFGKDYWSYMNDKKGTANGVELQTSFNWNKFDLDIEATYTKADVQQKNSTGWGGYDYIDVYPTYQPEWEGNVRLTYRPEDNVSIFVEGHYTDMYYTNDGKKEGGSNEVTYLQGRPVDELLVFNTGVKVNLKNNWQLSLGCNDLLNEGPKQKIYYGEGCYLNPEFPVQGRTYYATVKYSF